MAGAIARVTNVFSGGTLVAGTVISAVPCNLQELVCTNTGAATVYCQIHNLTSAPSDTAVPVIVFAVPTGATATRRARYARSRAVTAVSMSVRRVR